MILQVGPGRHLWTERRCPILQSENGLLPSTSSPPRGVELVAGGFSFGFGFISLLLIWIVACFHVQAVHDRLPELRGEGCGSFFFGSVSFGLAYQWQGGIDLLSGRVEIIGMSFMNAFIYCKRFVVCLANPWTLSWTPNSGALSFLYVPFPIPPFV